MYIFGNQNEKCFWVTLQEKIVMKWNMLECEITCENKKQYGCPHKYFTHLVCSSHLHVVFVLKTRKATWNLEFPIFQNIFKSVNSVSLNMFGPELHSI